MKKIKIKFVGFWPGFTPDELCLYRIMKRFYDVEISDDPDYIICSIFDPEYEYCNYPQVRIMSAGENYVPDFNLVDYAISRYPIEFQDRNFYLIGCADMYNDSRWLDLEKKNRLYPRDILSEKTKFANFIVSHDSEYNIRGDFFKELCKYKKVDSVGSYLNNTADSETVKMIGESKIDFQRKCKFSLCFESTAHEGFITEKISDAFLADTIPIYHGSSNITEIFNEKAFIYCSGRDDFDRVISLIKELDQNDDKYMEMLCQPIFNEDDYPSKLYRKLEEYIKHIFEQPLENAYRRSRVYWPLRYNDLLAGFGAELEKDRKRKNKRSIIRIIKEKYANFWK